MRERPILFSGPMVRAILAGTKTQTRRIAKVKTVRPSFGDGPAISTWISIPGGRGTCISYANGVWSGGSNPVHAACPYGRPSDQLWVRETWAPCEADGTPFVYAADADEDGRVPYLVSGAGGLGGGVGSFRPERWHPSIHMHRRASRISLDVTGVRLERLHDISEEDSRAEGVTLDAGAVNGRPVTARTHRGAFFNLWSQINGEESVNSNPWVWVVSFKRIEPAKEPG